MANSIASFHILTRLRSSLSLSAETYCCWTNGLSKQTSRRITGVICDAWKLEITRKKICQRFVTLADISQNPHINFSDKLCENKDDELRVISGGGLYGTRGIVSRSGEKGWIQHIILSEVSLRIQLRILNIKIIWVRGFGDGQNAFRDLLVRTIIKIPKVSFPQPF